MSPASQEALDREGPVTKMPSNSKKPIVTTMKACLKLKTPGCCKPRQPAAATRQMIHESQGLACQPRQHTKKPVTPVCLPAHVMLLLGRLSCSQCLCSSHAGHKKCLCSHHLTQVCCQDTTATRRPATMSPHKAAEPIKKCPSSLSPSMFACSMAQRQELGGITYEEHMSPHANKGVLLHHVHIVLPCQIEGCCKNGHAQLASMYVLCFSS